MFSISRLLLGAVSFVCVATAAHAAPPTPPPVPFNPFAFNFTVGPSWQHYSSSYSSTGGQTPGSFSSDGSGADICGGFTAYWPTPSRSIKIGGGLNVCGNTSGSINLFDIVKHPGSGHVTADVTPGARIEPFVGVHIALNEGPPRIGVPDHLLMRVGPVFADNKLSISSNQTGAGGRLESASESTWTTGFAAQLGLSTPVCEHCFIGQPLNFNVIGKGAWYSSSSSVNVQSSAFGFVETAKLERWHQYGAQFGLSTPMGLRF